MSATPKKVRIGIDVGGTFTHAVALDSEKSELLGKVKVPTTHHAALGVGQGVVDSLRLLLKRTGLKPEDVVFVAHSTTQATNSLLEGDVDPVGIVSLGTGITGTLLRRTVQSLRKIPVSAGRFLETVSFHGNPKDPGLSEKLDSFLSSLRARGVRVVVVVTPFSVEDPSTEKAVADYIRSQGFLCTPTHEVSQLYGVRVRARTTAINASILPKMMEVAEVTDREIRNLGIRAPFMIMRSDGGVMSVEEMRKKPILTLLSGPAAGIAAALRYLKITDGVFLEVGGTSTDISVIRGGRAVTRSATIGGNKTFLKTLDCRTLGVGGGSLPRVKNGQVFEVGPRSAHIARVKYAAFETENLSPEVLSRLEARYEHPKAGDPSDYLVFVDPENPTEVRLGFTPTCAANALGLVQDGDCARSGSAFPGAWDGILQRSGLGSVREFSEKLLAVTSRRTGETVDRCLKDYGLQPSWVTLVGGGGGASPIVNPLAKERGMKHEIARDHDVISAVGVALGLVRETLERSVVNPSPEDLWKLREEARSRVIQQGADPGSVEVFIEVDSKKNLVRVDAQGAIAFKKDDAAGSARDSVGDPWQADALLLTARSALGLSAAARLGEKASSDRLAAVEILSQHPWKLMPWKKRDQRHAVVVDSRGVVRLRLRDAEVHATSAASAVGELNRRLESSAIYGDGGVSYPYPFFLVGDRVIDLSRLNSPAHCASVLEMEIKEVPPGSPAVLILTHHQGPEQEN